MSNNYWKKAFLVDLGVILSKNPHLLPSFEAGLKRGDLYLHMDEEELKTVLGSCEAALEIERTDGPQRLRHTLVLGVNQDQVDEYALAQGRGRLIFSLNKHGLTDKGGVDRFRSDFVVLPGGEKNPEYEYFRRFAVLELGCQEYLVREIVKTETL